MNSDKYENELRAIKDMILDRGVMGYEDALKILKKLMLNEDHAYRREKLSSMASCFQELSKRSSSHSHKELKAFILGDISNIEKYNNRITD